MGGDWSVNKAHWLKFLGYILRRSFLHIILSRIHVIRLRCYLIPSENGVEFCCLSYLGRNLCYEPVLYGSVWLATHVRTDINKVLIEHYMKFLCTTLTKRELKDWSEHCRKVISQLPSDWVSTQQPETSLVLGPVDHANDEYSSFVKKHF